MRRLSQCWYIGSSGGSTERIISSHRVAVWLSRILLAFSTACITFAAIVAISAGGSSTDDVLWVALRVVAAFSFSFMGAVVGSRHPSNAVGWVFLLMGVNLSLDGATSAYAATVLGHPAQLPWGTIAAWYASWSWFLFVMPALVVLPLLYPTGRPLSRRWDVVLRIAIAAIGAGIVGRALEPGPLNVPGYEDNPLAAAWVPAELIFGVAMSTVLLCMVAATISLIVRFRRSRGIERQQLMSFFFVAALLPLPIGPALLGFVPAQTVAILLIALLPLATGFAILRQGLYDIDVLVRRTLVYGGASAVLAVLYFGAVALLHFLLAPLTAGSELAVAMSTLVVAAAFQRVRHRIQLAVDRRFYRERYNAGQTIDRFGEHLRDQIDLPTLESLLLAAVRDTVRPTQAGLWLRSRVRR
jgi:hypothetical protein